MGKYNDNDDITIETATAVDLNFATKAYLQFYGKWDIEQKYDYVMVQAAEVGSAFWTPLCGRYTKPGVSFPVIDVPTYDGQQYDWVFEQMDLDGWLGKKVKIRFELVSDASGNRDGFYFDDVKIVASYDSSLSVRNTTVVNGIPSVYPNPANEAVTIALPLFNSSHNYQVSVYDCLGREVLAQKLNGEKSTVNTSTLPANIYYLKISDNDNQYPAQKIQLIK